MYVAGKVTNDRKQQRTTKQYLPNSLAREKEVEEQQLWEEAITGRLQGNEHARTGLVRGGTETVAWRAHCAWSPITISHDSPDSAQVFPQANPITPLPVAQSGNQRLVSFRQSQSGRLVVGVAS